MRTVDVGLDNRSYSIFIGPDALASLGDRCARLQLGRRCAVISDSTVARRYGKRVMASLQAAGFMPSLLTVPAGEASKSLKCVGACYDQLAGQRLERSSFIVALGGGVVGDLAGFVAATYLRGISFVQVPTTLLAQVDSSVGGKVGINLKTGKNLAGAFHQPRLVLCDLSALNSLPAREFRAGLAEVIKYGIIYDAAFFARLESHLPELLQRNQELLMDVVARCCEIKADVVKHDEMETGLRAILNFGHTIGHAIEAVCGYGTYLHGEAISIGQVAAARLSSEHCGLAVTEIERIENLFLRAGLPTSIKLTSSQRAKVLGAMRLDKKVSGDEIKFVLARCIGEAQFGIPIHAQKIENALIDLGQTIRQRRGRQQKGARATIGRRA